MLTLYTTPLSANGRKVLAVRHHLGVGAEVVSVNVYAGEGRTPEHLARHPWGRIPVLVDGDLVLWESNAILVYLSDAYGDGRLLGDEPRARADVMRWLFFESSAWQPAFVPVLAEFVGSRLLAGRAPSDPARVDWHDARLRETLAGVDTHLADRAFLAGEALTLADFSLAGMMMYVRPAAFPFEAYPHLAAWLGRVERTEAWRATASDPWRAPEE